MDIELATFRESNVFLVWLIIVAAAFVCFAMFLIEVGKHIAKRFGTKSTYTAWYPSNVKPARVGWYECRYMGERVPSKCHMFNWNGTFLVNAYDIPVMFGRFGWRGLSSEHKA